MKSFIRADITKDAFPVSLLFREDDGGFWRTTVSPDDDVSMLPQKVQTAIATHWESLGGSTAWDATANPPPGAVAPVAVKAEALRRIAAAMDAAGYEDRGDMALAYIVADKTGDTATKTAVTDLFQRLKIIRAAGVALAKMDPIPQDFSSDSYWS